jgi:short-subunit dehydrogenase involved in D-alanine esterification of teichoic acids
MRRTIVTGGTKGIGFAIAQALLAEGGRVMITGRDQAGVNEVVRTLGAEAGDGSRIGGMAVDVRDRLAVENLVIETSRRFGGIDALVNNAGVGVFVDAAAMTDLDWDRVIDTNLTGAFYATRAVIPELRRSGGGWIINIASLAAKNYFPGGAAYCASKARLQRGRHAGSPLRRHPRERRHARLGRHAFQRPRASGGRFLEARARRCRAGSRGPHAAPGPQPTQQSGDPAGAAEEGLGRRA